MHDYDDEEIFILEIDFESDEFLDYVLIEMAKKGVGVDREAIKMFMRIMDDFITKKAESEGYE